MEFYFNGSYHGQVMLYLDTALLGHEEVAVSLCSHFAQRVKHDLRGPLGRRVPSGPENVTGMELRRQTDLALPGSLRMVPQTVSPPQIPLSPR